MNTTTAATRHPHNRGHARRVALAVLTLAALTTSGALATTAPATAATATMDDSAAAIAASAMRDVSDVGAAGDGTSTETGTESVIDPDGTVARSDVTATASARTGWTPVIGVAAGARIRARPVNGAVLGLIPYHAYYSVSCKAHGSDGYAWGYAAQGGRRGWVRADLWQVVQNTAPGAPPTRPIPWC